MTPEQNAEQARYKELIISLKKADCLAQEQLSSQSGAFQRASEWSERISRQFQELSRTVERAVLCMDSKLNFSDLERRTARFKQAWQDENLGEMMRRFRAAKANPDHPDAEPWVAATNFGPFEITKMWKYWPDMTRRRGRPRGAGRIVKNKDLLREVSDAAKTGIPPVTAARDALLARGFEDCAQVRSQAKYIARVAAKENK